MNSLRKKKQEEEAHLWAKAKCWPRIYIFVYTLEFQPLFKWLNFAFIVLWSRASHVLSCGILSVGCFFSGLPPLWVKAQHLSSLKYRLIFRWAFELSWISACFLIWFKKENFQIFFFLSPSIFISSSQGRSTVHLPTFCLAFLSNIYSRTCGLDCGLTFSPS